MEKNLKSEKNRELKKEKNSKREKLEKFGEGFKEQEKSRGRKKKKKETGGGKNLKKNHTRKLVGSERDARGERWKARRRKVRGAWIPSSRSRRRLEEESRWEEIGGRSGLAVHRLIHRPAGRSTSDTSHRRETLMQRARKCRPRCPLCVSATMISTRFSNFVSLRCVFRSIRNRLERLPIVLTVRFNRPEKRNR